VISNWDSSKGNYIFYNTNPPVSISEPAYQGREISVFPNPTRGTARLRSSSRTGGTTEVTITDLAGRKVFTRMIYWNHGEGQIDLSGLGDGLYILSCEGRSSLVMKKDVY